MILQPASTPDQQPTASEMTTQVGILLRVMYQFDRATAEHLDAVGALSGQLAQRLGFSNDEVTFVTLAGRLHDIGKIGVSRDIPLKPGTLNADEWHEIRLHPIHGAATVAGLPQLAHFASVLRSHHERYDGRGYPDGLAGEEIPIASRLIAVTDAFHAMTVPRAYSPAYLPHEALEEILRCRGTQFDPEIVDEFCALMKYRRPFAKAAADVPGFTA